MTPEEAAFRNRLAADPTDATARLVFADHLDELDRPLDAALQRVLARPDDDGMRLDYAAACDRAGDAARAEFVRVQVELATGPRCRRPRYRQVFDHDQYGNAPVDHLYEPCGRCNPCRRFVELQGRERELYDAGGAVCWDHKDIPIRPEDLGVHFRRGFMESVACAWDDWTRHSGAIRNAHPLARVRLTTWPELDNFRNAPAIDGVFARLKGRVIEADWPRAAGAASVVGRLLAAEWPGLAFELPPPVDFSIPPGAEGLLANTPPGPGVGDVAGAIGRMSRILRGEE